MISYMGTTTEAPRACRSKQVRERPHRVYIVIASTSLLQAMRSSSTVRAAPAHA